MTSSPGLINAAMALANECFAPVDTTIFSEPHSKLLSRFSLLAIAIRKSG